VQHTSDLIVQQEAQVDEQHDTSSDLAVQAISHKRACSAHWRVRCTFIKLGSSLFI